MSETTETPPLQDWEDLARNAAATSLGEEGGMELLRELLAFELADAPYAIPVERVREIVRVREITHVPRVPKWMRGVVTLRGEVVQVVDLRMRLGLEATEPGRRSRIIVLHGDDDKVTGVLVDAVQEVLRISEEVVAAAASGETGAVVEMCLREDEFVSIIDLDRVLELRAD